MARTSARLDREIDGALRTRGRRPPRLPRAARKANDGLHDLVNGRYFASIPLDEIFGIVEGAGLRLDPEEKACILTGRDGKGTWQLYGEPGQEVDHMLVLTWHKMDATGRWEVVAYVS